MAPPFHSSLLRPADARRFSCLASRPWRRLPRRTMISIPTLLRLFDRSLHHASTRSLPSQHLLPSTASTPSPPPRFRCIACARRQLKRTLQLVWRHRPSSPATPPLQSHASFRIHAAIERLVGWPAWTSLALGVHVYRTTRGHDVRRRIGELGDQLGTRRRGGLPYVMGLCPVSSGRALETIVLPRICNVRRWADE